MIGAIIVAFVGAVILVGISRLLKKGLIVVETGVLHQLRPWLIVGVGF